MSYDIEMEDENGVVYIKHHHFKGGTYPLGGTTRAYMNITYNYSEFYYKTIDQEKGINWLNGKTGAECLPVLEKSVRILGIKKSDDYWEATSGNAGNALLGLIAFCKSRPDGIFKVM